MARYTHTIDKKGRVIVPARLRDNLKGTLHVTGNLDPGYLTLYTNEQFNSVRSQLLQLSGTDPDVRRFQRFIIGEAVSCEVDSQGRISVSANLWELIGVEAGDEICFIDMIDKVEICSEAFYQEQKAHEDPIAGLDLSKFDVKGL
ncbi:MAG TPA: cell division/cell wall cluster transcriptional repressor MraZ [Clostridiaceae bacterium]|nr:cell division/cell wall cluster transcriptional repressor MraZ [Clostridiaceae bacterium]